MSATVNTTYAGEAKEDILQLMVLGNEAVEKSSLYINTGVQDSVSMPRMSATADPLQNRVANPTVEANAITYDEKKITPLDCMFFDLVNPQQFEHVWRPFQPKGALVDKVFDPKIQRAMIEVVSKQIQKQVGKLIWQGDVGAGAASPLRFFDGLVTKAAASAETVDVANAGVITEANVLDILKSIDSAIPNDLYDDEDMIIHMNTTDFRAFQDAIIAKQYKGQGDAEQVPAVYKGREIRYYTGLPKDSIIAGLSTSAPNSNFQAAVDMVNDPENVKFERYRPEDERYFLKVLFKMAVEIGWNQETVLYQGV